MKAKRLILLFTNLFSLFVFISSCKTLTVQSSLDDIIDLTSKKIHAKILEKYPRKKGKKKIAIASFINELDSTKKLFVSRFGFLLANAVHSDFFDPTLFELIERRQIDQLLSEIYNLNSGLYKKEGQPKIGRFQGADYILLGSIQRRSKTARLNIRLVDVSSATVVASASLAIPLTQELKKMLAQKVEQKEIRANPPTIKKPKKKLKPAIIELEACLASTTIPEKTSEIEYKSIAGTNRFLSMPYISFTGNAFYGDSADKTDMFRLHFSNADRVIGTTKVEYWYAECKEDQDTGSAPYKVEKKNIPSDWTGILDGSCTTLDKLFKFSMRKVTHENFGYNVRRFEISIIFKDKVQAKTGCIPIKRVKTKE